MEGTEREKKLEKEIKGDGLMERIGSKEENNE